MLRKTVQGVGSRPGALLFVPDVSDELMEMRGPWVSVGRSREHPGGSRGLPGGSRGHPGLSETYIRKLTYKLWFRFLVGIRPKLGPGLLPEFHEKETFMITIR